MESIDAGVLALSKEVHTDSLSSWTDEKRNEFVATFASRTRAARYIALKTAQVILTVAKQKFFIGQKDYNEANFLPDYNILFDEQVGAAATRVGYYIDSGSSSHTVGGRSIKELSSIAEERAELILSSLPPLKEAVSILNPEIAAMIERKDALFAKGKEIFEQTEELSGALSMNDFPDTMTLAEFKKMIKDRQKKRATLLTKLEEIGQEGLELERKINKFLYAGIPGLSAAVLKVAQEHRERATGLDQMTRRVTEQVKYGDSKAALEILSGFEKDEVAISDGVKNQFEEALAKLKVLGTLKKAGKTLVELPPPTKKAKKKGK